jgi:hypothetical protein
MRNTYVSRAGRVLAVAVALAVPVGLALAEQPQKTPGKGLRHPNLAAAQKLTQQAFVKLEAAQKANEYDLGGHAAKAKDLLKQAGEQIKLATEAADRR